MTTPSRPGRLLGDERPGTPADIERQYFPGPRPDDGAGAAPSVPPVRVALPPNYFAPAFTSQPFYPFQTIALGPTAEQTVALQQLDAADVGVIRSLGIAISNMLLTTDFRAVVLVNGNPVNPVRRIPGMPAVFVERVWDDYVLVTPRGASIAVRLIIRDAGGPYDVTGYLSGWSMPETEWARYLTGR